MRNTIALALAFLVVFFGAVANSNATFIQPTSITASSTSINTAGVLISDATGNGGASYAAPSPASGGGGTAWYTATAGTITTPVTLTFDFASTPDTFLELYLWDYYTHTPASWTLTLYSGVGGSGTQLLSHNFTFVPGPSAISTLHVIDFPDVLGVVLSGKLETFMNSASSGVGLAEIGFTTAVPPAPEPSTLALLGLGVIGMAVRARRRRRAAA